MTDVIIGNICSLCAMVSDSVSGTREKRSEILAVQILSQVFYGTGSFILKGYSSTAQNVVSILRNLAGIKNVRSRLVEWTLIALGVVLGAVFNNRGLLGWLPIAANFEYSVAVFGLKNNEKGLKLAFLINFLMFSVFNFSIGNYVGAAANIVVAVTTVVALIRSARRARSAAEEKNGKTEE